MDARLWNLFVVFLLVLTLNLAREGFDVEKRRENMARTVSVAPKPRPIEALGKDPELKVSKRSF